MSDEVLWILLSILSVSMYVIHVYCYCEWILLENRGTDVKFCFWYSKTYNTYKTPDGKALKRRNDPAYIA